MALEPDKNTGVLFESPKKPGSKKPDFKGKIHVTRPGIYDLVAWTGFTKAKIQYISLKIQTEN
jgi:hypothetical protein